MVESLLFGGEGGMLSAANTRRTRNPGRGGKWREERAGDGRGGEELEGGRGTEEQQQSLNATQRRSYMAPTPPSLSFHATTMPPS